MNTPYTYLIGWTEQNLFYYGVRYANDCNPNDLWKKYFTSSDRVQEQRELLGEPDIIQVRKTFKTKQDALLWEETVLRRIGVLESDNWLNLSIGGKKFCNNRKS